MILEREKEREGKLLRRLWTGRCSNFKGPIPIFNLLRSRGRAVGVKANSFYWLDPCRPSTGCLRVFSAAEEFHFEAASAPALRELATLLEKSIVLHDQPSLKSTKVKYTSIPS